MADAAARVRDVAGVSGDDVDAQYQQKFNDEAAAQAFGTLSSQGFIELEEGMLKLLEP